MIKQAREKGCYLEDIACQTGCSVSTVKRALKRQFQWFGGVSAQVLVDNQKAAVLEHPGNGQVKFNEGFLLLAQHYGFQPRACKPYRAKTKGKH